MTQWHIWSKGSIIAYMLSDISAEIDECSQNLTHDCDQRCNNTIGSYECSCDSEGFVLSEDGHSCLGKLNACGKSLACFYVKYENIDFVCRYWRMS